MTFELVIEPGNERIFGPCQCCGNMTQRVWGYVTRGEATVAAYFVEWTPGHVEKAANFDLILGRWGPSATPKERKAVAVALREVETGPAFAVVDAAERPVAASPLVGEALKRQQVIGKPIAGTVFAICDAIFLQDPRISPLR
jgi:hypothetical protein